MLFEWFWYKYGWKSVQCVWNAQKITQNRLPNGKKKKKLE